MEQTPIRRAYVRGDASAARDPTTDAAGGGGEEGEGERGRRMVIKRCKKGQGRQ